MYETSKSAKCGLAIPFLLVAMAVQGFCGSLLLPAIIGDNMLLRQDTMVSIWGWTNSDTTVQVTGSWQKKGQFCKSDSEGKWLVKVPPPKPTVGTYEISIGDGQDSVTIKNVLFGEVWVCSGQSNMEWPVSLSNNATQEIAAAEFPNIRLFHVAKTVADEPQADCNGQWLECSPETIPKFSAVGYFFGRELHRQTGFPIGLINSSWGGTYAECWTKKEILAGDEDFVPILQRYEKALEVFPEKQKQYEQELKDWQEKVAQAKIDGEKPPRKPRAPMGPGHYQRPYALYNSMIASILPYTIKGVIWYQGEANTPRAYQYRRLFPAMIANWRNDWGQGDFPFYFVQIAPWSGYSWWHDENGPAEWGELCEAQLMTLKSVPKTGMAVTVDISDINDIHPKNKQDVGKRLALWALAKDYGLYIPYSGPLYKSMRLEGKRIRINFEHTDSCLISGDGEPLQSFEIAGEDQKYVPAKGIIDGDSVLVFSDDVCRPVAVRYCWSGDSKANLYNKAGLPTSPFRTDNWPGITFGKR